jgi:hypothetical protein
MDQIYGGERVVLIKKAKSNKAIKKASKLVQGTYRI